MFGYLILISTDFYDFISPFSQGCPCNFFFDWEDISSTKYHVWTHFQSRSWSKKLRCASYFQLSFWCCKCGKTRSFRFHMLISLQQLLQIPELGYLLKTVIFLSHENKCWRYNKKSYIQVFFYLSVQKIIINKNLHANWITWGLLSWVTGTTRVNLEDENFDQLF